MSIEKLTAAAAAGDGAYVAVPAAVALAAAREAGPGVPADLAALIEEGHARARQKGRENNPKYPVLLHREFHLPHILNPAAPARGPAAG